MGSRGRAFLFITFTLQFTRLFGVRYNGTLRQGQVLGREDEMSSESGEYSLKFLSFPNGQNPDKLYLILTSSKGATIWLANRDKPLNNDSQPSLTIDYHGNLTLSYNGDSELIPIYSSEAAHYINASVILHNDGNMKLYEMNTDDSKKQTLWQSFDHLFNTLITGMRLGFNNRTRQNWNLTSMNGLNAPALGSFTFGMDPSNATQLVIWWQGQVYWTSGPTFLCSFQNLYLAQKCQCSFNFTYVSNENETYFRFSSNSSDLDGVLWLTYTGALGGIVDLACNQKNPQHVKGCVPHKPPDCRSPDSYVSLTNFEQVNIYQEGHRSADAVNLTLYDCGMRCFNNCSCVAYSPTTKYKIGCEMWSRGTNFEASHTGRQVYFIQGTNPIHNNTPPGKLWKLIITSMIGGSLVMLLSYLYYCYALWRKFSVKAETRLEQKKLLHEIGPTAISAIVNSKTEKFNGKSSFDVHLFSFESIVKATENFSSSNYLGKGGYGPVYKGKLRGGQEIAIKRLARSSRQGLTEFKNEVELIAKLQHTNLVRLHGVCIEREERMLIYEYMPNKSLDFYLFDCNKRVFLDWKKRCGIIQGIAQGLVYLHKYSRLKVIHRDLKPNNILLDHKMNPKISDFGMAKLFGAEESEEITNRLVGTRGYMAPEYISRGTVSTKIDVFSFGVLLLEIITGKKNTSCYHSDCPLNLIGYAWQLQKEGQALQLIDPILSESCTVNEILRYIHIGLLCVQDEAKERPTILQVVSFMSNESAPLAEPKQPAFFINTVAKGPELPHNKLEIHSFNDVTISTMDGR